MKRVTPLRIGVLLTAVIALLPAPARCQESIKEDTKTGKVLLPLSGKIDFTTPGLTVIGIPIVPTGTGFFHITGGIEDSAAQLVLDAGVDPTAAIAQSKLNLNGVIPPGWLGSSSTTAAAGNDSRLSDQRTPLDSSVTDAKVSATAAIVQSKLNLNGVIPPGWLGSSSTTAAAGNDSRLSDQRTPLDNSVTTAKLVDKNVTYGKIQDVTAGKLLGRYSASGGSTQEITISTGLNLDPSTGNLTTTAGGGNVNGSSLTSGDVITGAGSSSIQDGGVALTQIENTYQTVTVSAAGNTNSNISSQSHTLYVTANAGSGTYTATVAIPTSGRVAGDIESAHLHFAASTNPTVEIHNNTSGGTLLFTWTGDGTVTDILADCVFSGTSWYVQDAHFVW